jgi:hypothetical protein
MTDVDDSARHLEHLLRVAEKDAREWLALRELAGIDPAAQTSATAVYYLLTGKPMGVLSPDTAPSKDWHKYARHLYECAVARENIHARCTCGLDELLKE